MKKRISLIAIISFYFVLFVNISDVYAGTVNFNINGSSKVTVNDTFDLTVRASDVTGFTSGLATAQGDIHFDNSYLEYVKYASASSNLSVSYGTTTQRFVALGMSGEYISSADDLIKLTFKAKQVGTTTVSIDNVVVGDVKAIVHSANVNNKTVEIVAASSSNSSDDKKGSSNTGSSTSKPSSSSDVTPSSKSNDNSLESLTINDAKISPSFYKDTTTYNVVIPSDMSKLSIDYKTSNNKASVKVVGNSNLKSGSKVKIIVTAEDGTTKTYTLNITKSSDDSNNKLASLNVKESSIYPKFNSDVTDYTITLPKNVKKLTIDAIAVDKDSTVEIIDNKNLNDRSVVLVKVTDKNGFSSYYKLRTKTDDDKKIFGIKVKYIIVGVIIFLLLIIILLLLRRRRKKKEKYQDDLYDDVVTKDEILDAIEEKDPDRLKMLLTQEEANRLKNKLKKATQTKNGVSKEEIIKAIEDNDSKKLKELLKQEEENREIEQEESFDFEKTRDEEVKDDLVDAIQNRDISKLRQLIDREEEIEKLNRNK